MHSCERPNTAVVRLRKNPVSQSSQSVTPHVSVAHDDFKLVGAVRSILLVLQRIERAQLQAPRAALGLEGARPWHLLLDLP
jgi:hypothetical protein